jgi:hypothetical protein
MPISFFLYPGKAEDQCWPQEIGLSAPGRIRFAERAKRSCGGPLRRHLAWLVQASGRLTFLQEIQLISGLINAQNQ